MRALYLLIIITLLNSCNNKKPPLSNLPKMSKSISPTDSLRNTIIGQWGGLEARHPSFEIKQDSIYLFGRSISCPYKIISNDMVITLPEGKIVFRNIYVVKDTIFFLDEGGNPTKGFRFKNK